MTTKSKSKKNSKNWGFDLKNLDKKVRPQDDFFHYASGGWIKNNPIPPTKSRWGSFYVLREDGLSKLKTLAEKLFKKRNLLQGSESQFIRDFYKSGIDMKTRNSLGIKPIEKFLHDIEKINSIENLLDYITYLHKVGFSILWSSNVNQDDKDSEKYAVLLGQSGIALPDRDFYLKTDPHSKKIREEYQKHVENMFALAGASSEDAKKNAGIILNLETKLARISMNKVDMRDIEKIYHKKSLAQLQKLAKNVPWKNFLNTLGLSKAQSVIVYQPDFLSKATALLTKIPLSVWKTYLTWNILNDTGSYLAEAFGKEQFEFYGKVLTGRQEREPEWKRVVNVIEMTIGEALGKEYVKLYFPQEAKKKMDEMVSHLFAAYEVRLQKLDWMSDKTKTKALKKLEQITRKIGYPDKWKSYKGLVIKPETYFENVFRAMQYERKREINHFGKKVDREEWFIAPQVVNAFYSPNLNEIVFPAGILQPPFFDLNGDAGLNYGAIGSIIGHEITHGFDDQGAKFDGIGNFNNWWSTDDKKKFEKKTKILVDQFNKYKVGDLFVNGKLTLGENIADLGGAAIAYDAYIRHLEHAGREVIDGFTPEQRFFLGLATVECINERPESARTMVLVDPHAPGFTRVNGPASNLITFYEAFGVKKGDKLYREAKHQARIW